MITAQQDRARLFRALHSGTVARVSLGCAAAEAAYAVARRAAAELAASGGYTALAEGIPFPELNALLRAR